MIRRDLLRFGRRLAFAALVVASVAIIVLQALNIVRWSREPFFGYFIRVAADGAVVGMVTDGGAAAGLRVGDRVLTVNERPVASLGEIRRTRDPRIGSANTYLVERDGRRLVITIPTAPLGLLDALIFFGVPWVVGAVFLGLGVLVFLVAPLRRRGFAFLLFSFVNGVFITFLYRNVLSPAWLGTVSMASLAFQPAVMFHLGAMFPEERPWIARRRRLLLVPYGVSLALLLMLRHSSAIWEDIPVGLKAVWLGYLALGIAFLLGSIAFTYRRPLAAISRQRARVILFGFGLGAVLPVVESLLTTLFNVRLLPHTSWLLACFVFVPLSVGYAIVKHNLFDLDAIVRRTTGYVALTGMVVLLYAGLSSGFNLAFNQWDVARSSLFPLLSTLIIVFLLNPLRDRVQAIVDRLFYRTRADYRETVQQISAALTSVIALDVVVDRVLQTLVGEMFIANAALLLRSDEDGAYRVYRAEGEQGARLADVCLAPDSALVQLLRTPTRGLVSRSDLAEDRRHRDRRQDYLRELDALSATLVIPLTFTGELIGVLALGDKLSGRAYGAEDVTLLRTLADESAVAINNAVAFRKLEDLRASLEERVRARTEELAELNQKLEASNARLRELDQLKSDFVSDVSHELRTPLTSIKGYVDYLLDGVAGELSPMQQDFLARVRSNGDRLSRLINDLLDLARIEAGRVDLHLARLSPGAVAGEVIDVLRPLASDKGIDVGMEVLGTDLLVHADHDKLHQILLNLAHNAVKFTPPGGSVRVVVAPGPEGSVLTRVRDTGEGIPPEELSRVFEKFHQVGETAAQKGSGLGLTITQKLVALHGGAIWVESEVGKGTEFCFTLPAAGPEP